MVEARAAVLHEELGVNHFVFGHFHQAEDSWLEGPGADEWVHLVNTGAWEDEEGAHVVMVAHGLDPLGIPWSQVELKRVGPDGRILESEVGDPTAPGVDWR